MNGLTEDVKEVVKARGRAWNRMKKRVNDKTRGKYIAARGEYVRICREEERKCKTNIVNKCKEESKLLYRFDETRRSD